MMKVMIGCLFAFMFFMPLTLKAQAYSNVLVPNEPVQITSSVNQYDQISENVPIQGTLMVTHDANNSIDQDSFHMGDKPLSVKLVQSVPMSSYSNLIVTIYNFQIDGMKAGSYTLPSVNVVVGGKKYVAPPMSIIVSGKEY